MPSAVFPEFSTPNGDVWVLTQEILMKRKLITLALFGAFTTPCLAFADDATEITVVTPTRVSEPSGSTVTDTTVITQSDIRNSSAVNLPTLLKDVAGVEIVQAGGVGQQSSVFMRGANSNQVLILVDGVRMDSVTTGTTPLDQLMLDQIDHIEIVRGNVSSVYGSGAIGGVIQIFTKRGAGKPAFHVRAGAGSLNTQQASAGFGGQNGNTTFNLELSRFKTDGVSAINPSILPGANPDRDGYNNTSYSANLSQAINADNAISISALHSHGNVQFDNPYGVATDSNTAVSNLGKFSLASDNQLSQMWHSKLQWSQSEDDTKNYLNGAPDTVNGYWYQTTNRQLSWQNDLALNADNTVVLGAERLTQQLASDTAYTGTQRTADSFFGGYIGNFGAHQVQMNLRRDDYSDFGPANTGLLGYGYKLNGAWRFAGSYGTAFKAPTFNDLYYPYGYGNPNLQPERSHNAEAGLHYASNGQYVDLVYFNDNIDDLIACNSACTTVVNIGKARINGTELSYSGQMGNTGIKASITSQNPRDAATGAQLLRRARLFGNLGVTEHLGAWKIGAEWQHSSTREDTYYDPVTFASSPVILSSYNVFNVTASYVFDEQTRFTLRADNLTNQNDSSIYGYNPLGRRLFASISYEP
jgi:vitamin B12 transporter